MLAWACGYGVGERKLRLFAVALARRVWDRIGNEAIRRAVEVAERRAEEQADDADLHTAVSAVEAPLPLPYRVHQIALSSAYPMASRGAMMAAHHAACTKMRRAGVVVVLREVFGDDEYQPTLPGSACLTDEVRDLALAAYEERVLPTGALLGERLAVLSDALEEAGCTGSVLTHLRSPGPHVRGCWALDLILGKP